MQAILILAVVFLAYELISRQQAGLSLAGPATANPTVPPPPPLPTYTLAAPQQGPQQAEAGAASAVSTALNFVPVVGPVVSSIFNALSGGLIAASAKRAAQARSENAAVAAAVPGWDKAVSQVVAAYNAGSITAQEVYQFMASPQTARFGITSSSQGILWKNYWNETSPQIQPGRNGCHSGADPHVPTGDPYCSGSYGASCCVGYDDLDNGQLYICQAVQQAEAAPGTAVTSTMIPKVFASKYGGIDRPGYSVVVKKSGSTSLFGL